MDAMTDAAGQVATSVSSWIKSHDDGIVALMLLLSTMVVFSGRTMLRPTVFLMGFLPTSIFFGAVGMSLLPNRSSSPPVASGTATTAPVVVTGAPSIGNATNTGGGAAAGVIASSQGGGRVLPGLILLVAVVTGILAGIVVLRLMFSLANFVITASSGVVLVLIVHLLLLSPTTKSGEIVLFCVCTLAGLLAGMLSLAYPRTMLIIGTAFDGAAVAIFCLAHFLGNQPDVLATIATVKSPLWAIGYCIATIMLGTYGAIVQMRVYSMLEFRQSSSGALFGDAENPGGSIDETEKLLVNYGSVEDDFSKAAGLSAGPLLSYGDDDIGSQR